MVAGCHSLVILFQVVLKGHREMVVCLAPHGHCHGGVLGLVMASHAGTVGQGCAYSYLCTLHSSLLNVCEWVLLAIIIF